jgi:hypothetical protein
MNGWADGCIGEFGAAINVKSAETPQGREGRGFISPVSPKDDEKAGTRYPGGRLDCERYLLIASSDAIAEGETERFVSCLGTEYELLRAEKICVGGAQSHWEGIMRLKAGVAGNA